MAFVIMSTGSAARPRLHTVGPGTLLAVGCVAVLLALGAGFVLGLRWQADGIGIGIGASPAVAAGPGSPPGIRAGSRPGPHDTTLIDRVGALAGRLIRLENEAGRLAEQVGKIVPSAGAAVTLPAAADPAATSEPSGGPLLAPEVDRLEARLSAIAAASTMADLDSMAFPSRLPVPVAHLTSGFGNRRDPFTGRLARHTGLDFRAAYGAPIHASAGGRVRFAGYRGAYGRTVEIDHGNGLVTRYGHASRLVVKRGDIVLPGQEIALAGSTGRSTGPHVHFEVLKNGRPVAPGPYLARNDLSR
ncbi:MAG: M23 family peptidase [Gammaproteobacteria bacterium PRO9]|nr:M23 family peptidase [Gammaproteobacteria bacterium PRO9]